MKTLRNAAGTRGDWGPLYPFLLHLPELTAGQKELWDVWNSLYSLLMVPWATHSQSDLVLVFFLEPSLQCMLNTLESFSVTGPNWAGLHCGISSCSHYGQMLQSSQLSVGICLQLFCLSLLQVTKYHLNSIVSGVHHSKRLLTSLIQPCIGESRVSFSF